MKTYCVHRLAFILLFALFFSCKKEFDTPPVKSAEAGTKINIAQIKAKFNNTNYRFKSDSSLYCVVIADETSGNLYKDIYVRDATGALHVKLIDSGGLFIGDSIRINLKDCFLNDYNDLIQLDSVNSEKNIVKLSSGANPQPITMTIKQLVANTAATNSVQSKLIRLENVQFVKRDTAYSDFVGKNSFEHTLEDCFGNNIIVRTSGYSYFASNKTPKGNGTFIGIAGQFRGTMQLIIRDVKDINMTGALCASVTPTVTPSGYLNKDFNDGSATSGGWLNVNVTGTVINWTTATSTTNPTKFGQCNNFIASGNQPACETWLISGPLDLSGSTAPTYSFTSAFLFSGPTLTTYVSTNYNSGAPSSATWTPLSASFGTNSTFKSSGLISLSSYKTTNVRVAFKYLGNLNSGSRWQIDDIRIFEP